MESLAIIQSARVLEKLNGRKCTDANRKAYSELIEKIIDSRLGHGANQERIDDVLSLRLGKKARLLAVKREVEGKQVWLLLEILPNHKYKKAYFRKLGKLTAYLDSNEDRITALALTDNPDNIIFNMDEGVDDLVADVDDDEADEIKPQEVIIYNKQIIHLTDEQDECLAKIVEGLNTDEFLALVAGTPGSGKTLLAKEIIDQVFESSDGVANIFYVAESENLRREMAEQCGTIARDKLGFCDYQQMLIHAGLPLSEYAEVGDKHLEAFFNDAKDATKRRFKTDGNKADDDLINMTFSQFRQECLVIAGIKSQDESGLEEYKSMGGSHSLFNGNDDLQLQLWNLCQGYLESLKSENKYHTKLTRFDLEKLDGNPVLVVDEALDLTRVQLQNLVAMGFKVVFLGDYNQDLEHTSHSMEYIRRLIATSGIANTYLGKLSQTHRCTKFIANVASNLLAIKKRVTLHGSDFADTDIKSALDKDGIISIATTKDTERLKALCDNVDTAVICMEDDKADTARVLAANLVFSVNEIKGLGYKRVILKDLVTKQTAQRLLALLSGRKNTRDHITAADRLLITDLNNLFTAVSRAQVELIFMNTETHPAINELMDRLTDGAVCTPLREIGSDKAPSTPEQWRVQFDFLLSQGMNAQAAAILERFQGEAERLYLDGNLEEAKRIADLFDYTLHTEKKYADAAEVEYKESDAPSAETPQVAIRQEECPDARAPASQMPVAGDSVVQPPGEFVLSFNWPRSGAAPVVKPPKRRRKKHHRDAAVSDVISIDFSAPTKDDMQQLVGMLREQLRSSELSISLSYGLEQLKLGQEALGQRGLAKSRKRIISKNIARLKAVCEKSKSEYAAHLQQNKTLLLGLKSIKWKHVKALLSSPYNDAHITDKAQYILIFSVLITLVMNELALDQAEGDRIERYKITAGTRVGDTVIMKMLALSVTRSAIYNDAIFLEIFCLLAVANPLIALQLSKSLASTIKVADKNVRVVDHITSNDEAFGAIASAILQRPYTETGTRSKYHEKIINSYFDAFLASGEEGVDSPFVRLCCTPARPAPEAVQAAGDGGLWHPLETMIYYAQKDALVLERFLNSFLLVTKFGKTALELLAEHSEIGFGLIASSAFHNEYYLQLMIKGLDEHFLAKDSSYLYTINISDQTDVCNDNWKKLIRLAESQYSFAKVFTHALNHPVFPGVDIDDDIVGTTPLAHVASDCPTFEYVVMTAAKDTGVFMRLALMAGLNDELRMCRADKQSYLHVAAECSTEVFIRLICMAVEYEGMGKQLLDAMLSKDSGGRTPLDLAIGFYDGSEPDTVSLLECLNQQSEKDEVDEEAMLAVIRRLRVITQDEEVDSSPVVSSAQYGLFAGRAVSDDKGSPTGTCSGGGSPCQVYKAYI
ncbi:MAG: AAA family ATPase [Coxiellaceae bacterium]|nr:AAA family ATPase [Coxiellaceae bacterium]